MRHRPHGKRADPAPAICQAIEARTYLSVTFASPAGTNITGVRAPIVAAQFDAASSAADLAVTASSSVKILIGNAFGTFTGASNIPLPASAASLSPFLVGNFSGNGSDIVLLSQNTSTHNGVITYEASNSDGTFNSTGNTPITNSGHGFAPIAGVVGDFNGDNLDDLAILGKPATGSSLVLSILTSNGDGTFSEAHDYTVTASNSSGTLTNETLLAPSLDGGLPDIVLYDGSSANLDVFMNGGDGSLSQLGSVSLTATQIISNTFTNSGFPDLIAANGTHLTPLLGNGDGTFTANPDIIVGAPVTSLSSGDLDLDGFPDLVTNLGVLIGGGDGTFSNPVALPQAEGGTTFSSNIITADLDGDGRLDIAGISSNGNVILTDQNITPTSSMVSVTSNQNLASPGQDVQFTATVSSSLSVEAIGQVDFIDNGVVIGSSQIQTGGAATFDAGTALTVGVHSITARYDGDSNFFSSTSDPFSEDILTPSATTLTASTTSANAGDDITFTASVTGNDGNGDVPTGTVEFFDDATDLGGSTLDGNGNAVFDIATLAASLHHITAQYQADSNFAGSTSTAIAEAIQSTDLSPLVVSTTLPSHVVAGTPLHATATVQLNNTTVSTIAGPLVMSLFASTDGSINDATLVTSLPARNLTIRAGATITFRFPIQSLPATLTDGNYVLIAQVTYNGITSAAAEGPAVAVAAPFISLSESFPAIKLPSTLVSGATINGSIKVLITNSGNVASKGATAFSLSASMQHDQPGTAIPVVIRNLNIPPMASRVLVIPIKSIPAVTDGPYFLVMQVTDPSGNVSVATPEASFQIAAGYVSLSASLSPITNIITGETITLTNSGNIDDVSTLSCSLGFSLDTAGLQPAGSTTIALTPTVHIKAGKTNKIRLNQWKSLFTSLTSGTHYYLTATIVDQSGETAFAVSPTTFSV